MVFSSLFFIYFFLPLNLVIYKFAGNIKARNAVMLIFSLIFYAWGEPVYVFLLVGMTFADWLIARFIDKQEKFSGKAKLGVALMCIVNLGLLGVFKYGNFVLENLSLIKGFPKTDLNILLPIGISFYTFQLMSYVIDVYRKEVPAQKKFTMLLLYVSLFHQCIAGPIVRYKDVWNELMERHSSAVDVADGVWRFMIGVTKKALLANSCAVVADTLLKASSVEELAKISTVSLWGGVFAFSLQIYLDFSAYSDMAIGMGRMIGIHYIENFDYPYMSRSVTEFWRRWHISLGTFFRDYLYIPLGGNRKGFLRTTFNLLVVWAMTGLWHGASWNFVLWGLYFFVFLFIEKLFLLKVLKKVKVISNLYLIVIVFFGWILFKFESVAEIVTVFKGLFGLNNNAVSDFEGLSVLSSNVVILAVSVIACTSLAKRVCEYVRYKMIDRTPTKIAYALVRILVPIVLLIISTAALVGDSYNPFLYFRF